MKERRGSISFGMFSAFNTGRNMAFFDVARNLRIHIRTSCRCYRGLVTVRRIIGTRCRPWPMEAVHAQNVPELGKTQKLVPIAERFSALCCGADSPRHRFKHCKANTTLRVLRLNLNLIGDEGACALAVALKAPVVVCKGFCGGCSASLHSRVSKFGARRKRGSRITNTMVVAGVSRRSSAPLCRDCTPQVCQCESWCDRSTR